MTANRPHLNPLPFKNLVFPMCCPTDGKFYVYRMPYVKKDTERNSPQDMINWRRLRGFKTLVDARQAIIKFCSPYEWAFCVAFWKNGKLKVSKFNKVCHNVRRLKATA